MHRFFLLIAILFFFVATANAAPALQRGLNLSNWLANAERQKLNDRDFSAIEKAGFDFVRLPVNPESFGFRLNTKGNGLDHADFTPVDKALAMARQHHLAVILDIHPQPAFEDRLEKGADAEQAFTNLWIYLARRYDEKNYPPDTLAFDLLNEPHYYHNEGCYEAFMARLAQALRKISPNRTLIVAATHGASLEGLQLLHPLPDTNTVYDFHFYEPALITHQGVHRGFEGKMTRYFHDLPYPSSLADHGAAFYAPDASNPAEATRELNAYVSVQWDGSTIASLLKLAQDWADLYHVRVICGEFGVLRTHIDMASRDRWIADTRTALEKDQIGWALWDYTDLFGITQLHGKISTPDPVDGSTHLLDSQGFRTFEPAALAALGLK